jgi:long-chain acyl-CoA synthetase
MLLSDLLVRSAEQFPDKAAVIAGENSITFAELHRQSSQIAARLRRLGVGPGSRVALLHENAVPAVIFFWGVLNSGAQIVDVPCLAGRGTIAGILFESKPAVLIASERQVQRLTTKETLLPQIVITENTLPLPPRVDGAVNHSLSEILHSESEDYTRPLANERDVALIMYTSGTSGQAKGVMLSHRNLLSNIVAVNSLMGLTHNDSILLVVPLYFIHGRMQLLTHALVGGTIAFSAGFQFPQAVVGELARYRVTAFSGVPYHFSMLMERTRLAATPLPDLRYVVVTGGALTPQALRKLSEALPGVAIHVAYGQTEASPRITNLDPSQVLTKVGSCGLPVPGVRIEIANDDGSTVEQGEIGEVVVTGPNVMRGYVSGDEVESGKIDQFGRLHTGDLGKLDSEGYLYLVGRKSELIKSAGERVFPREIETVLETHPGIRESAVLGIPDTLLGEKIVACVVLRPGAEATADNLRTHCLKFLPLVRIPREVRFSQGLPKTASGKTDRTLLTAHFEEIGAARTRAAHFTSQ